jgi:RHS repeat-associated protein
MARLVFCVSPFLSAYSSWRRRSLLVRLGCMKVILTVAVGMLVLARSVVAQQDPAAGNIPFSTQVGGVYETVDLASSNVLLQIPIRNKSGKLPFSFDLTLNTHAFLQGGPWQTISPPGLTSGVPIVTYSASQTLVANPCGSNPPNVSMLYNFSVVDRTGASHPIPSPPFPDVILPPGSCNGSFASATSGDGYTLTVNFVNGNPQFTIYDISGDIVNGVGGLPGTLATIQDPDGATITESQSGSGQTATYTDTLGATVLTVPPRSPLPAPWVFHYTDAVGNNQPFQVNYSSLTQQTNFGCPVGSDMPPTAKYLPTLINTPAGNVTLTYETTPGDAHTPHYITGRLAGITYATGASVSYAYSGGYNGNNCSANNPVVPLLTKTLTDVNGNISKWTYANAGNPGNATFTVTVTDPAQNQTVYTFANEYQTQAQYYEGSASGTPLKTVVTCYDGNYTSKSACVSPSPSQFPFGILQTGVEQTDVYTYSGSSTAPSMVETKYDSYGNVASVSKYDFGATYPPSGTPTFNTTTTYDNQSGGSYPCGNLATPYINNRPCSVTTSNSGTMVSQVKYTYNSTGHPVTVSEWISGTIYLQGSISYNSNGTVNVKTDVNGTTSTYSYSGVCNSLMPTGVIISGRGVSQSRSMSWDCNGGVQTSTTDENGHVPTVNFTSGSTADPFYRPLSVVDAMGYTTNFGYTPTTFESAMNFDGTHSTTDILTTTDGLGRSIFGQKRQGQAPGTTTFDSTQTAYSWTPTTGSVAGGALTTQSMPYAGTTAQAAPAGTPVTTTQYDAIGRPLTVTDGGGGTVSYTYVNNRDVLQKVGPTQLFQKQFEYDGIGRLTSVCEITSVAGSGSCGQSNPATGYVTKYTYTGNAFTVTQNGVQTRSYNYDGLGRLTSEQNPEWGPGTANYTYDTACGSYLASPGDLTKSVDSAGNITCYTYDGFHRLTDAGNAGPTCRHLRYDNNVTPPSGITVSNNVTRLTEAYTDACSGSIITDEWFGYDADGRVTDIYEFTPHSGSSYYHTIGSYWANGLLDSLSGIPGVPTIYYGASNGSGLDGEGRVTKVSAASGTNPVTSVSYSATTTATALPGSLKNMTFGSTDSDGFTYDPNTGRQASYTFNVSGMSDKGTLTWNPNGTLAKLKIVDNLPGAIDSQTCSYFYDDLGRLGGQNTNGYSVDCGSVWQQLFTFDAFGNITKSGSITFTPTYSATTNRFTISGVNVQYDGNGNLLTDNINNTYTWDPNFGNPKSVNGIGLVYDALGRMVEQQNGASNSEILYSPAGKTALMSGQTLAKAFIALPGGGTAIYNSTGLAYFRHSDWLGSSRLTSTVARAPYSTSAYAPFGEQYAVSGASDASFTGQNSDTVSTLYDFQYREHSPSQGRWVSPDPAGLAAADPSNPQSWNRYSYALNNPLSLIDPFGLWCVWGDGTHDSDPPPPLQTPGEQAGQNFSGDYTTDPANYSGWSYPSQGGGATQSECKDQGGYWDPTDSVQGCDDNTGKCGGNAVICSDGVNVCFIDTAIVTADPDLADIARCAAKVGNSLSFAALLPPGSNRFLQNALSNDFSTLSDLATGPAGGTRLNAAASILQGKLTTATVKGVGAIPVGPDLYKIGVNGAGTHFVEDVVTTPLAEKVVGKAAGALLDSLIDIKLAWDATTYAYGAVACWGAHER